MRGVQVGVEMVLCTDLVVVSSVLDTNVDGEAMLVVAGKFPKEDFFYSVVVVVPSPSPVQCTSHTPLLSTCQPRPPKESINHKSISAQVVNTDHPPKLNATINHPNIKLNT